MKEPLLTGLGMGNMTLKGMTGMKRRILVLVCVMLAAAFLTSCRTNSEQETQETKAETTQAADTTESTYAEATESVSRGDEEPIETEAETETTTETSADPTEEPVGEIELAPNQTPFG